MTSYPCIDCSQIVYISYTVKGTLPRCDSCKLSNPKIIEASMVVLPADCTYNGIRKVVGSHKRKEDSIKPINIIDENPDGSYKVTRIGKKGDIDGD